jgi:N-terminal acetyltransferase B complex non-catalytic subunit
MSNAAILKPLIQQGWLSAFLKIYIRAFQQASDLDDTVEDKLLIGDRPKPHIGNANKGPVKERVAEKSQDEIDEVCHELYNDYWV